MITILLYALTLFCLVIGLAGAIYTELPKKVTNMSFVYYGFSLPGHLLALQFLLISAAIFIAAITGEQTSTGLATISGFAGLLFILNLWRSYQGGKVLDGIYPGEKYPSFGKFMIGALLPFKTARANVKRIDDIAYGEAGVKNRLDIYVPTTPPDHPLPVLVHIHGGAWTIGHKRQQARPLIQYMVSRGWMAVDINYRLGPKNRFPVIFEDVLRAIAFVKTNIADYGGDPEFVALTGGSAGGHLSSLAALMPNNKAFKNGFADVDCTVDACVPVYGVYDFLDRTGAMAKAQPEREQFLTRVMMPGPPDTHREFWDTASPIANVHEDAPPMLVLHGRHDALAPFKGAEIFVEALRSVSRNEVVFAQLPSGQHAYDAAASPPTPAHVRAVERFLNSVRANKTN